MTDVAPRPNHDVVELHDGYFVRATSSLADDRTRVLKQGESFAVFDRYADVHPVGRGQQGIYFEGTRHLSRLELRLGDDRPLLLSSTVTEDNALVVVDLTNPPRPGAKPTEPTDQETLHIFRTTALWEGVCYQRLRLRSFALAPLEVPLSLWFTADFADIFEVRGLERARRGELLPVETEGDRVTLAYRGLDGVVRTTVLEFEPAPPRLDGEHAHFPLTLSPGADETLYVRITSGAARAPRARLSYGEARRASREAMEPRAQLAGLDTSNEQFNDWLNRSVADLRMMLTETPDGLYPYAGVPWFSTPFGRDGIITALETLWLDPTIAAGVLRFLAAHQAHDLDPDSEAEPGKILHEARGGEMAALGEVPFRRYYGTIDATPLFVLLAARYYDRTADRELLDAIWPNVRQALAWIDEYGDCDGDGFVEYACRAERGLVNQGWKDSADSVFREDGELARAPIALCEVQAYVFGAKRGAATLAELYGDAELASRLRREANELRRRFEKAFWLKDQRTYALALDADKQPCRVRTSNAGHCLFTGLVDAQRARAVAATLLSEESFSGWGIRTLATSEPRYNPMSYHDGSVWPHDNALIALGFARYGLKEATLRVLTGLFDATLFLELHRMPELFCGFPRRPGEGPTLYPSACAPQAWAAGAVFPLLEACLGARVSAREERITFANPMLPPFLGSLRIRDLRVGNARVDLELHRHPDDVGIQVVQRDGDVEVVVVK